MRPRACARGSVEPERCGLVYFFAESSRSAASQLAIGSPPCCFQRRYAARAISSCVGRSLVALAFAFVAFEAVGGNVPGVVRGKVWPPMAGRVALGPLGVVVAVVVVGLAPVEEPVGAAAIGRVVLRVDMWASWCCVPR